MRTSKGRLKDALQRMYDVQRRSAFLCAAGCYSAFGVCNYTNTGLFLLFSVFIPCIVDLLGIFECLKTINSDKHSEAFIS